MEKLFNILLGCMLIYIAIIDLRTQKITNRSLVTLLAAGLGATWQQPLTIVDRVAGILLSGAPLLIISIIRPGAFGGGDIKLAAIAGALLGYEKGLVAQGAAFITGGVYSVAMLITGRVKRKDQFAFGPFICLGIGICIFFANK